MRVLVQRVSRASVTVAGEVEPIGKIGRGLVLLVGVTHDDTPETAASAATKVVNLRIFEDEAGLMNRSALDLLAASGDVGMLVVSQFTLYADTRKGRRPSFVAAAPPAVAEPLVAAFAATLRRLGLPTQEGRFGAEMAVELINDGPVTIWIETGASAVGRQAPGRAGMQSPESRVLSPES